MAKLTNEDFRLNPEASATNAIKIRADVCKCGATICNYSLQMSSGITKINLGGAYDGNDLQFTQPIYDLNTTDADKLQSELRQLLQGLTESITVVYNTMTGTMDLTITGSQIEMKDANDAYPFSQANCRGTGH